MAVQLEIGVDKAKMVCLGSSTHCDAIMCVHSKTFYGNSYNTRDVTSIKKPTVTNQLTMSVA